MELAEIATLAFVAGTVTYRSVCQWRNNRQWQTQLQEERPATLAFRLPADVQVAQVSVLAFNGHDALVKKVPQAEVCGGRGGKHRVNCLLPADTALVCLLIADRCFGLGELNCLADTKRLADGNLHLWMALHRSAPAEMARRRLLFTLEPQEVENPATASLPSEPAAPAALIPATVNVDAMAKFLRFDLYRLRCEWQAVLAHTDSPDSHWIEIDTTDSRLLISVKANFSESARTARIELRAAGEPYTFTLTQGGMNEHPDLQISRKLYVSDGNRAETVEFLVKPGTATTRWRVKDVLTTDGGRWWNLNPRMGTLLTGEHTLRVSLEPKPANVPSRTATLTIEAGSYPLHTTEEIGIMQGLRFGYYIEYPAGDPCARHDSAIETPLGCREALTYAVRVDSNQPWRIVADDTATWMHIGEPADFSGLYSGTFTVTVELNEDSMKNGCPAARSTTLSLVTDTGMVRDILVYQGGYVRIKGQCWLDRNIARNGVLTEVAVPIGLDHDSHRTWGAFFQFGAAEPLWKDCLVMKPAHWHLGTEETPLRRAGEDPSPVGWRVPSALEMARLADCRPATDNLLADTARRNICLLSDDGVPFFLPLCGHLSHINGCHIDMAHCNRYWCGTAKSSIYGYSLCMEPGKQMCITHEMKKYGFPLRPVLAAEGGNTHTEPERNNNNNI